MNKYLKNIFIFLFGMIVGIILFGTFNKDNNNLSKIEIIEVINGNQIKMTKLGTISNIDYYIYDLAEINYIDTNKKSLYTVLEEGIITIEEILKEMELSDNCGGFIYSYDGKGSLGNDKFSILKGENKYVFTSYNPDLPDEIFNEFCKFKK